MMRAMRSCCRVSGAGDAGAARDVPWTLLTAGTWRGCAGVSVGEATAVGACAGGVREVGAAMGGGLSAMMAQLMPKTRSRGRYALVTELGAAHPSKLQNFPQHRSQGPELVTASAQQPHKRNSA
jgi:hypothetical protein